MDESLEVRRFWLGRAPLTPETLKERQRLWFGVEASRDEQRAVDDLIRARFGGLMERAAAGALGPWEDSPHRRLSLILLLDQFPRHVFRGTARAFATDDAALSLTLSGLQAAADVTLSPVERLFFYMPLQHAERSDAQEESLGAHRRLLAEVAGQALRPLFAGALDSAELHHSIVARFGRFPHRNLALGRESTPEEEAYLARGGHRFGQ